jgi:hypothetical protein
MDYYRVGKKTTQKAKLETSAENQSKNVCLKLETTEQNRKEYQMKPSTQQNHLRCYL